MSKLIRSVTKVFINRKGFFLYENNNKTVSLYLVKVGKDAEKKELANFNSLKEANNFIKKIGGHSQLVGVHKKLQRFFS